MTQETYRIEDTDNVVIVEGLNFIEASWIANCTLASGPYSIIKEGRPTQQEFDLTRYCQLRNKVAREIYNYRVSADCWCENAPGYNQDTDVWKFIEAAVDRSIKESHELVTNA